MNAALLEAALDYAGRGRRVLPLHGVTDAGGCSCGRADCPSPAKHPRTRNGVKDASSDAGKIRRWWRTWPDANVGWATGGGLVVLDVDPRAGGDAVLGNFGTVPETEEVATGGGGRHYVFRAPPGTRSFVLAPGVELKGAGGYVVAAPSLHASGRQYAELRLGPVDVPAWVEDARRRRNGSGPIAEGERNDRLTSIAGRLRRDGVDENGLLDALRRVNAAQCRPPLDDAEVAKVAASVGRYPPGDRPRGEGTGDAVATASELLGAEVERAEVFGRGVKALVVVHLADGRKLETPFGDMTKPQTFTGHVVTQLGLYRSFEKGAGAKFAAAIFHLADHRAAIDEDATVREWCSEYLRVARTHACDLENQRSRWEAFCALEQVNPTAGQRPADVDTGEHDRSAWALARASLVLRDVSGLRLVRSQWLYQYVRRQVGGLYSPSALANQVLRAGWERRGSEGKVKATEPDAGGVLIWAFWVVPHDWTPDPAPGNGG